MSSGLSPSVRRESTSASGRYVVSVVASGGEEAQVDQQFQEEAERHGIGAHVTSDLIGLPSAVEDRVDDPQPCRCREDLGVLVTQRARNLYRIRSGGDHGRD